MVNIGSDIRVLKLLLERREEKFTIRKMAAALKMNYRIAYEQSMKLEKDGLIRITKAGNSKICEFADRFDHRVFEAESLRREELLRNKDLNVLHARLAELKFPFISLIFGSHAKNAADRHSDIDILTVGGDEKEIRAAISILLDRIHLTCVTYGDFIVMARSREFTVVSEAMKSNIILIGIEEYHRLMKNAG